MTSGGSRTYKLRLSAHGVDLFLDCHHRLARLARDFIPYGATLAVAVGLLDRLGPDDVLAELDMPACGRLAGDIDHFVGCSIGLADSMRGITDRLMASGRLGAQPAIGKLYIVGLMSFGAAEDDELVDIYRRSCAQTPRRGRISAKISVD